MYTVFVGIFSVQHVVVDSLFDKNHLLLAIAGTKRIFLFFSMIECDDVWIVEE